MAKVLDAPADGDGEEKPGAASVQLGTVLKEAVRRLRELESSLPRPGGKGLPILVVDDDSVGRGLLVDFLGRYGPTAGAQDGQEALSLVTRAIRSGNPFRLICLDLMMPGMDGGEVLHRIRSLEEVYSVRTPAVVATTTALGDRESVLKARAGGSGAYFVKPIDFAKLGRWVESLNLGQDPPRD